MVVVVEWREVEEKEEGREDDPRKKEGGGEAGKGEEAKRGVETEEEEEEEGREDDPLLLKTPGERNGDKEKGRERRRWWDVGGKEGRREGGRKRLKVSKEKSSKERGSVIVDTRNNPSYLARPGFGRDEGCGKAAGRTRPNNSES